MLGFKSQVIGNYGMIRTVTKGDAGGFAPPRKYRPPGKMCWTWLKIIGLGSKNLGPSQKTLAPPGVPSWLRTWA